MARNQASCQFCSRPDDSIQVLCESRCLICSRCQLIPVIRKLLVEHTEFVSQPALYNSNVVNNASTTPNTGDKISNQSSGFLDATQQSSGILRGQATASVAKSGTCPICTSALSVSMLFLIQAYKDGIKAQQDDEIQGKSSAEIIMEENSPLISIFLKRFKATYGDQFVSTTPTNTKAVTTNTTDYNDNNKNDKLNPGILLSLQDIHATPVKLGLPALLDFLLDCYCSVWQSAIRCGNDSMLTVMMRQTNKKKFSTKTNDFRTKSLLDALMSPIATESPELLLYCNLIGLLPRQTSRVCPGWGHVATAMLVAIHCDRCLKTNCLLDVYGNPSVNDVRTKLGKTLLSQQNKLVSLRKALRIIKLMMTTRHAFWMMSPLSSACIEFQCRLPWQKESIAKLINVLLYVALFDQTIATRAMNHQSYTSNHADADAAAATNNSTGDEMSESKAECSLPSITTSTAITAAVNAITPKASNSGGGGGVKSTGIGNAHAHSLLRRSLSTIHASETFQHKKLGKNTSLLYSHDNHNQTGTGGSSNAMHNSLKFTNRLDLLKNIDLLVNKVWSTHAHPYLTLDSQSQSQSQSTPQYLAQIMNYISDVDIMHDHGHGHDDVFHIRVDLDQALELLSSSSSSSSSSSTPLSIPTHDFVLITTRCWQAEFEEIKHDLTRAEIKCQRRAAVTGHYDANQAKMTAPEKLALVRLLHWYSHEGDFRGIDWDDVEYSVQARLFPFTLPPSLLHKSRNELHVLSEMAMKGLEEQKKKDEYEDSLQDESGGGGGLLDGGSSSQSIDTLSIGSINDIINHNKLTPLLLSSSSAAAAAAAALTMQRANSSNVTFGSISPAIAGIAAVIQSQRQQPGMMRRAQSQIITSSSSQYQQQQQQQQQQQYQHDDFHSIDIKSPLPSALMPSNLNLDLGAGGIAYSNSNTHERRLTQARTAGGLQKKLLSPANPPLSLSMSLPKLNNNNTTAAASLTSGGGNKAEAFKDHINMVDLLALDHEVLNHAKLTADHNNDEKVYFASGVDSTSLEDNVRGFFLPAAGSRPGSRLNRHAKHNVRIDIVQDANNKLTTKIFVDEDSKEHQQQQQQQQQLQQRPRENAFITLNNAVNEEYTHTIETQRKSRITASRMRVLHRAQSTHKKGGSDNHTHISSVKLDDGEETTHIDTKSSFRLGGLGLGSSFSSSKAGGEDNNNGSLLSDYMREQLFIPFLDLVPSVDQQTGKLVLELSNSLIAESAVKFLSLRNANCTLRALHLAMQTYCKEWQLEQMKFLDLAGNPRCGSLGGKILGVTCNKVCMLVHVNLSGMKLCDSGLKDLLTGMLAGGGDYYLQRLDLKDNDITIATPPIQLLQHFTQLKALDLSYNCFTLDTENQIQYFTVAISSLFNLEVLSIAYNKIQDNGFTLLLDIILFNIPLRVLDVAGCFITNISTDRLRSIMVSMPNAKKKRQMELANMSSTSSSGMNSAHTSIPSTPVSNMHNSSFGLNGKKLYFQHIYLQGCLISHNIWVQFEDLMTQSDCKLHMLEPYKGIEHIAVFDLKDYGIKL